MQDGETACALCIVLSVPVTPKMPSVVEVDDGEYFERAERHSSTVDVSVSMSRASSSGSTYCSRSFMTAASWMCRYARETRRPECGTARLCGGDSRVRCAHMRRVGREVGDLGCDHRHGRARASASEMARCHACRWQRRDWYRAEQFLNLLPDIRSALLISFRYSDAWHLEPEAMMNARQMSTY